MIKRQKIYTIISSIISVIMCITVLILGLTGCNAQVIDTTYTYNKAIIKDVGTVNIKSWRDYDDSDMVQVTTTDGTVYYTHGINIILIND